MDLIQLYGLIDNVGAALGMITNVFLISIIFRVARGKLQSYSYLVLISSIFDLFFCVVEIITQHQLLVRHGIVFIMAHGIERHLGDWAHYFCMIPHIFSCSHAVLILGPQFMYRCDLITGANANLTTLLKYSAVSSAVSLFVGLSAGLGIYQAKQRGFDYYRHQMDGPWFNENAKQFFTYACDIRDLGTFLLYGGGLVFTIICFWVSVYAIWKTLRYVRGSNSQVSERTASLQRQFTISLIVQTANACVFAVIPVSQICVLMLLRLDLEFVGIGTMVPLSWLSFANASITIYVVKAYRHQFLSWFFCGLARRLHPLSIQTTHFSTTAENLSTRQPEP